MLLLLPTGLLALLFASPILALAQPSSPNDPFLHIAKFVPKTREEPVCCLRPLPSSEPTEEIELLSFEDWKAKQQSASGQDEHKGSQVPLSGISNDNSNQESTSGGSSAGTEQSYEISFDQLSLPHFRVPLTDRFNYASLDCSARIHSSHKSAKSPYAILDSKKDRYMLSPCKTGEKQFVVIELCDDIRIDTVQLANFEFFSGVFKEFNVSVAKTYTLDPDSWTFAGSYTAKNVRGVQSFHPPTYLRDFYRILRIDFISHYGSEFYCPVSLLRVYGLTHLEQWKWDVWEAESRAKMISNSKVEVASAIASINASKEQEQKQEEGPVDVKNATQENEQEPTSVPDEMLRDDSGADQSDSMTLLAQSSTDIDNGLVSAVSAEVVTSVSEEAAKRSTPASELEEDKISQSSPENASAIQKTTNLTAEPSTESIPISNASVSASHDSTHIEQQTHPTSQTSVNSTSITSNTSSSASEPQSSPQPSQLSSPPSSLSVSTSATTTIVTALQTPNVPSIISSGESIYKTIMNRLTGLEANSSLYMRYVEEQTRSIREALRRLEEDVGRNEGLAKAQAQFFQKSMHEWDKQRLRLEQEYLQLATRVGHLADEVTLEKRLGIAQLILLLTILIFMTFTRGSRGESLWDLVASPNLGSEADSGTRPGGRKDSLREWSARHLKNLSLLSFRSGSSTPTKSVETTEGKVKFPARKVDENSLHITSATKRHSSAAKRYRSSGARTPVGRHFSTYRPSTPTTPSSSHRPLSSSQNQHPRASASSLVYSYSTVDNGGESSGSPSANGKDRPGMRRVNSQSVSTALVGPVPRSARKMARSAHLHEMRSPPASRQSSSSRVGESSANVSVDLTILEEKDKIPALDVEDSLGSSSASQSIRIPFSDLQNSSSRVVIDVDAAGDNESWVDTDGDAEPGSPTSGPDLDADLLGF